MTNAPPCGASSQCQCPPGGGDGSNAGGSGDGGQSGPSNGASCGICGGVTLPASPQAFVEPGMAVWNVREPYLDLEMVDEPLGYQPACGSRVAFRLNYRQTGALLEDPTVFSVGPSWSSSFRAFVYAPDWANGNAQFHRGGAGWIDYVEGTPQRWDGSLISAVYSFNNDSLRSQDLVQNGNFLGYEIQYQDGSVDTFTTPFNDSATNTIYFLTTKADPAGNIETFNYAVTNGILLLTSVTDADGHSTQLFYNNATYPNLITEVEDPFSRTCLLAYDSYGSLTNITDPQSLSSGFAYDRSDDDFQGSITSLTTPYGSTGFEFGGAGGNGISAYVRVTLPTGGHHLYAYRSESDWLTSWSPTVPDTSPLANTFENDSTNNFGGDNTWHWGPLQYQSLYTTDPYNLSSGDYQIGRMRHWLDVGGNPSSTLSLEIAPSPDGTTQGEVTWFDYENKAANYPLNQGSSDFPSFIAKLLPDGSTAFSYSQHGQFLKVTNNIATYTALGDSVALRTNKFLYAANGIDLVQWIGPNSEQVVSNYFAPGNTIHKPDASFDALNEGTYYTYAGCGLVTSIHNPAGLTTTNIY